MQFEQKVCDKCGATWLNGEHRWTGTGAKGNELDLAGLVCNNISDTDPDYNKCINPKRGQIVVILGIIDVVLLTVQLVSLVKTGIPD